MNPCLKWQKISVQLIWVLGHVRCDGNEIDVQLDTEGTLHLLTGPEAALDIYMQSCQSGDQRLNGQHWQSIHGQRQAKAFLKSLSE
jgi:hypothetical protein